MTSQREQLRLSEVLGVPVVEEGTGRRLGHAWDVRVDRQNKTTETGQERWVAVALVITARGALERFGFLHVRRYADAEWRSNRDVIAWDRIKKIGPREIVVSAE